MARTEVKDDEGCLARRVAVSYGGVSILEIRGYKVRRLTCRLVDRRR